MASRVHGLYAGLRDARTCTGVTLGGRMHLASTWDNNTYVNVHGYHSAGLCIHTHAGGGITPGWQALRRLLRLPHLQPRQRVQTAEQHGLLPSQQATSLCSP